MFEIHCEQCHTGQLAEVIVIHMPYHVRRVDGSEFRSERPFYFCSARCGSWWLGAVTEGHVNPAPIWTRSGAKRAQDTDARRGGVE